MQGFISYSREDEAVAADLRKRLSGIEREFDIQFFRSDDIRRGSDFSDAIIGIIDRSSIHIVLISTDSLWSDFFMATELPRIRAKQRAGDLVLFVIVNECAWELLAGALIVLPRDDALRVRPIKAWPKRAQGYERAVREIRAAIDDHLGRPSPGSADA